MSVPSFVWVVGCLIVSTNVDGAEVRGRILSVGATGRIQKAEDMVRKVAKSSSSPTQAMDEPRGHVDQTREQPPSLNRDRSHLTPELHEQALAEIAEGGDHERLPKNATFHDERSVGGDNVAVPSFFSEADNKEADRSDIALANKELFWKVDPSRYDASKAVPGSVLYLVKSSGGKNGKYDRLRAVMETWGTTMQNRPFLVIGDLPAKDLLVHAPSQCEGTGGYWPGLPCRVAFGLALAAKHPSNWSWVYMVDDDHYVVPHNVEQFLAHYDSSQRRVVSCFGCGSQAGFCHGRGGFCGGCGIAFSRAGLEAMVLENGETKAFELEHDAAAHDFKETFGTDDTTTGCVMLHRVPDMTIDIIDHVDISAPDNISKVGSNTPMLAWHHVEPDKMIAIDAAVRHVGAKS